MGGFDLGSLLSAFSSGSGINVQLAVAQALAAESGPMVAWQQQQAVLQSQSGDISVIQGHLTSLQTALNALSDPAGSFMSTTASSSDPTIVTASAAPGASPSNHTLIVTNVATTGSWYSDPVASGTTTLPPGSFTLQVGANAPVQVDFGNGVNTLDDLVSYINGLNAGVTANVVTDSNGARLSIVSNNSGAANDVVISGATGLTFNRAATGGDAHLSVDGIPIVSASNTVTGVVAGLTFNLVSAAPGVPVNISTTIDTDKSTQAVNDFVAAYNQVIQDVNHEFTVASNGAGGPLAGDSTLRMLQDIMLSSASFSTSGTFSTLASLGITMNDDGTLTVDGAALDSAMTSNFTAVQSFFQGTGSNGFASTLDDQLNMMTDPTNGAFTVELKSISDSTKDLQDHIDNFQEFLKSEQARLTDQYNKVAALLQQLPILEKQIAAQLGGNNNNNG